MKKAFLFLLSLFAFVGVQAQSVLPTSEPTAGDYYVYNVERDAYIVQSNDYGTRAGFDKAGLVITVNVASDGTITLVTNINGDGKGIFIADGNPQTVYVDNVPTPWTVECIDETNKIYTLKNGDNYLLAKDGQTRLEVGALPENKSAQWQFIAKADRQDLSAASKENPVDVTYLVENQGFDRYNGEQNSWKNPDGGNWRPGDGFCRNADASNNCAEVWNQNFDIHQSYTGLENGVYQLRIQGYYRISTGNDSGYLIDQMTAGNNVQRAKYYINGNEGFFLPQIYTKLPEVDGDIDVVVNGTEYRYPNGKGRASIAFRDGYYENEPIQAIVKDGNLTIGVKLDNKNGQDWVCFDNVRLFYLGLPDVSEYVEALNNAIAAAENFTGETSTVLAEALSTALAEAKGVTESTDQDVLEEKTAALNAALHDAEAVNVSVLKATVALAKAEGITTTEAEEVINSATESGPVDAALKDLRFVRKAAHMETDEASYEGNEPAEGEFYIYNVGRKAYLIGGSDWGTHAALGYPGLLATLATENDGFTIQFNELIQGDARDKFLNGSPYVDGASGSKDTYVFTPVDGKPGVYHISGSRGFLAFDPYGEVDGGGINHYNTVTAMWEAPDGEDAEWMLITKDQRLALMDEASKENPVDATLLIRDASFNKFAALDNPWADINQGWGWGDRNFGDKNTETWNSQAYNLSQEVTFLKAGKYVLRAQAYYRDGDCDTHANKVKNGEALHDVPVLYVGDKEQPIVYIHSEVDKAPGEGQKTVVGEYPNYMDQAAAFFQYGLYWNSVEFIVEEDNTTLTIGVKKTGSDYTPLDWVVVDNFRLTYMGEASDYDRALVSIEDGANYRVFTEVDGEKYYLTANGVLDSQLQKAGVFNFKKVAGGQYEYGFQLTSPLNNRFTNPYNTAESSLTIGRITVTDGSRNDWEAQVFFKNAEGKYAVRGTNAKYNNETSGWSWIGNSYWTVDEGPVAEYSFDQNYVWQLEEAEADNRQEILAEVRPVVESWGKMLQDIDGLVTDASMYYANSKANESIGLPGLLDGDYDTYFHTMWGNSGVTEPHYLEATLPDAADKFYYYFVKRDPVNNGNVNNRPIHIAISGSNDGETFTPITDVDDMPLSVPPVNYMSELITADQAYKIIRFTVLDTNNHATDNNGNKFFTFSEFYILPSNELTDAATALLATDYTDIPLDAEGYLEQVAEMDAILKGYFKDVDLNLVLNDEVLATLETTILIGKEAPAAPTSFYTNEDVQSAFNGLAYFKPDVDEVTEETDAINYTAESAISESFERAKWFNMNIRGGYWVTMDETEPYMPTAEKDLESEASQWAFGAVEGEPNQIVIWNRAAGPDMSLLNTGEVDANNKPLVAMREGQTAWDFAPNSDGFVIHQVGTGENEWVNQNGGASGPFSIWNSPSAKGDGGSVLRIFFVEETEPIDPYDAALAEIKNNHHYRVFTEVAGEKYYVNGDGTLTTDAEAAPSYLFQQAPGGEYEYGFKLNNNGTYFSNPSSGSSINDTKFNTSTRGDNAWEAQVFFLNGDGFYAVRSTNAPAPPEGATSGWNWVGSAYWTVNEAETPTAGYSFDKESNFIWQLEPDPSYLEIALNLVSDGSVIKTEIVEYLIGDTPEVPQSFREETHGLALFTSDVEEITEETTEVNFTAESILSESFEDAKWFNMNIRGGFWVATEEGEQYNPTTDKDLEAPESQWAFGAVEGEPNQLIVWNRAFDGTYTLQTEGGNGAKALMAEGEQIFEAFACKDGFVIRPLGLNENDWINQFGGTDGYLGVWQSGGGRNDDGSILRVSPVEMENLELAIDVERYVGQGYTPTIAEVDFTEALEYLGAKAVTEDMLYFVNPDGTEMDYATYKVSPTPDFTYDGWCDAEGAAAQWNSTTNMINVKFFEAIPDGQFSICDMNGADEVGKTYTVKWALKANDKAVVYAVNVTFVDAPVVDLTFDDLNQVSTEEITVQSELGAYWEGLQASVDIDAILAALGVESLDDVTITAVQSDGYLEVQYQRGANGEDGWRDENGDFMNYPGKFYVKADFTRAENQLYEIGTDQPGLTEPAQFTATYAFIKTGTEDAVVLKVNLVYGESGAVAYDGTVDVTGKIQGQVVAEAPTADETITITPNEDGTVNINFASLALAAPGLPVNDFIVENVVVTENEDGSMSYSLEGATVSLTAASGMIMTYNATLTGTQAEGEGPEITLILAQPSGLQNEIVFHPNALVPEAEEFDGMIKQILSHPQTGVQGQATGEQTVTIEAGEDGKVNITYSGFTMPVTGAVLPEFTVEGVEATQNEDGSISYALPEDAEAEVVIDRGTGTVTYKVALEGTQEDGESTPVLKLTLENSVVDTVWFGADEKTIDKAIATGINGVNALGTEGTIFDLSGRKVEKIQRSGIYIVNGKKVSVK